MRQLSAIFDTRALGYTSSLVAARYPDDRLFEAAAIVGGHPGVSHNYRRTHAFNLWYTLAVEPDSRLGLEDTMERLAEATRRRVDAPAADAQALQDQRPARHDRHPRRPTPRRTPQARRRCAATACCPPRPTRR